MPLISYDKSNNRVFVEVIMYARELETQLRSLKMNNEVGFGTHIV